MPTPIAASNVAPAAPQGGAAPYIVKPGDTLSAIAKNVLGAAGRWNEIYELNRGVIPNPNALRVGIALVLPGGAAPQPAPAQPNPAPARPDAPAANPAPGGKSALLTFDDGPNPVNTPKVLAELKAKGAKAVFFVTGQNATEHPGLIKQIVDEGHALGNHTFTHANLAKLGSADIQKELKRTQDAIDAALGYHYPLRMVRPPYGASSDAVREVVGGQGGKIVLWDVDSEDWKNKNNPDQIMANVFAGPYSVYKRHDPRLLFHDIHPQTAAIIGAVMGRLLADQFALRRADELLFPNDNNVA